jgi:tRNA modification GTPase
MRIVFNKADLICSPEEQLSRIQFWQSLTTQGNCGEIATQPEFISCLNGHGLEALETGITNIIQDLLQSADENVDFSGETVMITRERHRRHVRQCVNHLESFLFDPLPMDLAAEEIRLAMQELGKVTGRVDVEELLDIIFRDFCIGK